MALSKYVCPGCLNGLHKGNHELIEFGGRTWHKDCLEKLQAGMVKPDAQMFKRLSSAFNHTIK